MDPVNGTTVAGEDVAGTPPADVAGEEIGARRKPHGRQGFRRGAGTGGPPPADDEPPADAPADAPPADAPADAVAGTDDEPDDDDDAPAVLEDSELRALAQRLLHGITNPVVLARVRKMIEDCEKDPACTLILEAMRQHVRDYHVSGEHEIGAAPWIKLPDVGVFNALYPPEIVASVKVLNALKAGNDAAKAKVAAVKADAAAGDPKAQAALANIQQAAKILEARGESPNAAKADTKPAAVAGGDGWITEDTSGLSPAAQRRGGFAAYERALEWMRSGK